MSFKESVSKPGEVVELVLKASPGPKFAVSAVDQSILLMADSNDIKESQVCQLCLDYFLASERSSENVM